MDNGKADWVYYSREIEVYKLVTQVGEFIVTLSQGEVVKQMLGEADGQNRMIFIDGTTGVRLYLIQSISKVKKRFFELPDSVKRKLLSEGDVFSEEEIAGFSIKVCQQLGNKEVDKLDG